MRTERANWLGVQRIDQPRDREKSQAMKLEQTLPMGSLAMGSAASSREVSWYAADSTARSGRSRKFVNLAVSAGFHTVLVLFLAVMSLAPAPEELETPETKMDMVLVRMPEPEPPGSQAGGSPGETRDDAPRPKALARRAYQANVSQLKSVVQQQVTQIAQTQVYGQVTTVDTQPIQRTQAPKAISNRVVETATVDALQVADSQQASAVSTQTPTLRAAPSVAQSAGPRVVDAAGPVLAKSDAIAYQQATIQDGVADSITVQGDSTGPRVRALESGSGKLFGGRGGGGGSGGGLGSGTGDGMGPGGGGTGTGGGTGPGGGGLRDCSRDPACLDYLEMIRQRVYARWNPAADVPGGKVQMSFLLDKSGSAHGIQLVSTENKQLGDSCVTAFRHASPFPPPPPAIAYIFGKKLVATFDFGQRGK
jgi:hypothetical protein